ncbi:carbohydrate kinase family protein [Microbacterium paludicola]|nr:carbohydrate kinase [Microbacterium paludicola]
MTDILVIGESVADVIRQPDGSSVTHPGGSPANVAFGLARLGVGAALLTELGDDEDGALIRNHLEGAGATVLGDGATAVPRTPRATARIRPDGSAEYDFEIGWTLAATRVPLEARHLHTGSIAAFLQPGADAVLGLLADARGDSSISIDPNIRPALLGDHGAAVARFEQLVALADVVKASDEDLAWLYPGQDLAQVLDRIAERGALVVVTRGSQGAMARVGTQRLEVPAVATTVVDTVGAGDSFMAALLTSLHRDGILGAGLREALAAGDVAPHLERAARAAAITVSRAGANPPTSHELQ